MTTEANAPALPPGPQPEPALKIIGVGSAGLHALEHLTQCGFAHARFAALHTDARALSRCTIAERLLLGEALTRGLGAGGDAELGRAAAQAEAARLTPLCQGHDLIIIVAGLGGGTGSGAAPVLARVARETGALVLGLATLPFAFEGAARQRQAQRGLRQLKTAADAVICLPNQKVATLIDGNTTLFDTFKITNEMLAEGVRAVWRLLTRQGLITVDFADLCRVVRGRQLESCFAIARARGENRAREILAQLKASPMLDGGRLLSDAEAVLVSIAGGADLTLKEVDLLMEQIHRLCDHSQVIMGATVEPHAAEDLAVTLVAARRTNPEADGVAGESLGTEQQDPPTAEFPTAPAGPGPRCSCGPAADRPASRFVPPPPDLSPEEAARLLARQARGATRRRKEASLMRQGLLPLDVVSKGRFAKSEPTIHQGEDLDTPTYIRRGVALN